MTRSKEPKIITQIRSRVMDRFAVNQLHPMVYVDEQIDSIDLPEKVRMRHEVSLRYETTCPAYMTPEARKVFVEQVRYFIYAEFIEDLLELRKIACEEDSMKMVEKTKEILAYVKGI